jgi:hypothetical protein
VRRVTKVPVAGAGGSAVSGLCYEFVFSYSGPARRRLAVLAASITTIAAGAPVLLRHAESADFSDAALSFVVGAALAIAAMLLVFGLWTARRT